ncbi:MAG TPA: hypothetical protein VGO68_14500 [Pyrinomonadaceae bacterium]|jgi:hypothetical protein|nr:hypothetical protein [Pyrinomonadaceae bacterium]
MKKFVSFNLVVLALLCLVPTTQARDDGFGDVVKLIEQFYHVKHQGLSLFARAGMKTATTVVRISGGRRRQLAEAGSVRIAYFEDQDFTASGSYAGFKSSMNAVLAGWTPLFHVASFKDEEQSYIYIRDAGEKFNVMVITIDRREAFVVQMNISPQNLAKLMQDPDEMGQTITSEATDDQ